MTTVSRDMEDIKKRPKLNRGTTKLRRKTVIEEERNRGTTKQSENNEQDGITNSLPISSYIKCKCIKFANQKA